MLTFMFIHIASLWCLIKTECYVLAIIPSRDTESGWLEMKVRMLDPWERKWCEFNMADRCFAWGDKAGGGVSKSIPFVDILMVETDVSMSRDRLKQTVVLSYLNCVYLQCLDEKQ